MPTASLLTPARGMLRSAPPSSLPPRLAFAPGVSLATYHPLALISLGRRAGHPGPILASTASTPRASDTADTNAQPPPSFKRLVARGVGESFREVADVAEVPMPAPGPDDILVRVEWAGINGGCETFRARGEGGFVGNKGRSDFPLGAEGVGLVAAVGSGVEGYEVGQPVAFIGGGYSEYVALKAPMVFPVPEATAEWAAAAISGATASVALHETAGIKAGETVLVTAAAGGTGHFAVQIAKLAGCHVIGTCRGGEKAAMLVDLGVDRVVDYTQEDLGAVLKSEYPAGVDVAYEGVGGHMFKAALDNLAEGGRLVMVGYISGYPHAGGDEAAAAAERAADMFWNSRTLEIGTRTVRGNVWPKDRRLVQQGKDRIFGMIEDGRVKVVIDQGRDFEGLGSIADAIEWMLSGESRGKVVVRVPRARG